MALGYRHIEKPSAEVEETKVNQRNQESNTFSDISKSNHNKDKDILDLEAQYKASVRQYELSSLHKSLDHIEGLIRMLKPGIKMEDHCEDNSVHLEDACFRLMKELDNATKYLAKVCYQRQIQEKKHILNKAFIILQNKRHQKRIRFFYIWKTQNVIENVYKSVQDSCNGNEKKEVEESKETDFGSDNDKALVTNTALTAIKTPVYAFSSASETVEVTYAVEEINLIKSLKAENKMLLDTVADRNLRLKATLQQKEASDNEEILRLQRRILKLEDINSSLRLEVFDRTRAAELLCKRLLKRK